MTVIKFFFILLKNRIMYKDLNSQIFRPTNKFLGPYDDKYPNVVISNLHVYNYIPRKINTLNDIKYSLYYCGGLPRVSSTPLSVNSMYNRFPYISFSSLQTSQI
jgi:hypothetical protein